MWKCLLWSSHKTPQILTSTILSTSAGSRLFFRTEIFVLVDTSRYSLLLSRKSLQTMFNNKRCEGMHRGTKSLSKMGYKTILRLLSCGCTLAHLGEEATILAMLHRGSNSLKKIILESNSSTGVSRTSGYWTAILIFSHNENENPCIL